MSFNLAKVCVVLLLVTLVNPVFAQSESEEIANKVLSYINENLVTPGSTATLVSVEEINGIYKVVTEYKGNKIPVYVTKDGSLLFASQPFNTSQDLPKKREIIEGESTCEDLPKSDTPKLEAFLVSYCPFGLQMQRILTEIVKEIPQLKDYVKVRYMGSIADGKIMSMHGEHEAQENLRQICIREEQGDKYWDYISCFIKDGNTTRCLNEAKINTEKLNACMQDRNRGLKYAQEDFDLQNKYSITGSPTLILNGEHVSEFDFGGRTADAVKTLLCCGFTEKPCYCERNLSTERIPVGFVENYSITHPEEPSPCNCNVASITIEHVYVSDDSAKIMVKNTGFADLYVKGMIVAVNGVSCINNTGILLKKGEIGILQLSNCFLGKDCEYFDRAIVTTNCAGVSDTVTSKAYLTCTSTHLPKEEAKNNLSDEEAWNTGCGMWRMRGCKYGDDKNIKIRGYDPDGDGEWNSLRDACIFAFGISAGECWEKCCGFDNPELKECNSDSDCHWCEEECISKDVHCLLIKSPPKGYECKCINGVCRKVKKDSVDKTKLLEILMQLEQLKIKFSSLKTTALSIAEYYDSIGNEAKTNCWREVSLGFDALILKLNSITSFIGEVKENPTKDDITKIKEDIAEIRESIDKIIDKVFMCVTETIVR